MQKAEAHRADRRDLVERINTCLRDLLILVRLDARYADRANALVLVHDWLPQRSPQNSLRRSSVDLFAEVDKFTEALRARRTFVWRRYI